MAGRPKNRLELRRQYEAAEPADPMEDESDDTADGFDDDEEEERKPKRKPKAAKPRARATKAAKPAARMRVVWLVVNDAFKTLATFEYSQKEAAEAKAAELNAKGKGVHFVQRSKEAMPEDAPGLGAAIPREAKPTRAAAAPKAPAAKAAAIVEDDEDADNDDDAVDEEEDDDDDDDD